MGISVYTYLVFAAKKGNQGWHAEIQDQSLRSILLLFFSAKKNKINIEQEVIITAQSLQLISDHTLTNITSNGSKRLSSNGQTLADNH